MSHTLLDIYTDNKSRQWKIQALSVRVNFNTILTLLYANDQLIPVSNKNILHRAV